MRYGLNTAVMVLLVLGVIGFVEALSYRHNARLDLTENRRHSLSAQTVQLLGELKQDVHAVAFFRSDQPGKRVAEDLLEQYERAFELGIPPGPATRGVAYYNLACAYARTGQKDKALESLSRAVDEGFSDRAGMERDEDLAPLRPDPRFQQLLSRIGGGR